MRLYHSLAYVPFAGLFNRNNKKKIDREEGYHCINFTSTFMTLAKKNAKRGGNKIGEME